MRGRNGSRDRKRPAAPAPARPAPHEVTTLLELLAWRARVSGGARAFTFEDRSQSFAQLWRAVERFAAALARRGVGRGDRVLLALPNGPDFFAVFYGIQRAGGVAVPVFPGSGGDRLADLARLSGAVAAVVEEGLESAAGERLGEAGAGLLTPAAAGDGAPAALPPLASVTSDDVAYVQYTSGSTGEPKGVQLSHANLLTNVGQLVAGMEITAADVFVTWLPVHHDMGLVLKTMVPFALAAELVILPTSLRRVGRWLETIERHRATFTAAPDFAWRLALRAGGGHDLSSLRVALNAAEPVRAATLERFAETFGLADVMMPGYGLAEATVGVAMWPPGTRVAIDRRGFPSVGPPFPGVELRILGEEGLVGPGETGEILVRSPAATRGYLDSPEATAALFEDDGFLHTGDLGYLDAGGNLYIVGRLKNIIIQAGRNLAPSELEEAADALDEIRLAAAVGIDRGGEEGEQAWLFAEARAGDALSGPERRRLTVEIVRRVHERLGIRPARVVLVRPRSIPLTHNGKVRHRALREAWLDGSLRAGGAVLFPDW